MFDSIEITELRNRLNKHHYNFRELLVAKTGLSRSTISKFFNAHPVKSANQRLIYAASTELIQEAIKEKHKLVEINQGQTNSLAA